MPEAPSAAATATLYDGRGVELLVAYTDGATGTLQTIQFEETRADKAEIAVVSRFAWERRAHAGAALVVPDAGLPMTRLDEYWVLWSDEGVLYAQAARHDAPLASPMRDGEWIIDRPLAMAKRELHVYAWQEGLLTRRQFGAESKVDAVLELPGAPVCSLCAPVPGDDGGTAFIGCAGEVDGSVSATALYVRGGRVMRLDGKSEGQYRLMRRHKMGMHVGVKTRPALTVLTESREDGAYAILEASFDFARQECVWKRTRLEFVAPGSLVSAASFYFKTQDRGEGFLLAVNREGQLQSLRRRFAQTLRTGVGPRYGYPILTTAANRYEVRGEGEGISLYRL
jgi:hypothetical protein